MWLEAGNVEPPLRILSTSPNSMILEFRLDSCWVTESGKMETRPSLDSDPITDFPVYQDVIVGIPRTATAQWFISKSNSLQGGVAQGTGIERSKGLNPEITIPPQNVEGQTNLVHLNPGPDIRGHSSMIVRINPVLQNGVGLTCFNKFTIQLTWETPATLSTPRLLTQSNISEIARRRVSFRTIPVPVVPDYQFSENLIKVVVDTTAWFSLSYEELADSSLPVNSLNPRTFQLWHGSDQQMIYVEGESDGSFDPGDRIIFQGKPALPPAGAPYRNNFYTNDNVFWLSWGGANGLRYIEESVYPNLPSGDTFRPASFLSEIYIEKDDYFDRLGSMGTHLQWDSFDHFFMNPPIYAGTLRSYDVIIPSPIISNLDNVSIELNFQGITFSTHSVKFLLNDHLIGSGDWDDQQQSTLSGNLSQEFLQTGLNQLTVLNQELPDQSNRYDVVYLNWIKMRYQRQYQAFQDQLLFSKDGTLALTTQFEIKGFSSPDIFIFKEGISRLGDFIIVRDTQTNSYTAILQDYISGTSPKYHSFTGTQLRAVKKIQEVEPLHPITSLSESNYVIIAPDSFKLILDPLAEYHGATVVDVEEIYRTFSGGQLSPYAVKDFLRYAYFNWTPALDYILIANQGKWMGWRGSTHSVGGFIPAMRIQTVGFGAVSSDFWYTLLEGNDLYPDAAIGRFPVRTKIELENMVGKSLSVYTGDPLKNDNDVLNIGGYELTFKDQSEQLVQREIEQGFFPIRLYVDMYSEGGQFYGTTDSLLTYVNQGVSYINFLGHGGGAVWGDRSLLTLGDVDLFDNAGKLPIVTSMTCFTGDVTNPNALGRRLITREESGVIGWFGSAGVGWIINDFLLLQPLHSQYFSSVDRKIGDMINQAKIMFLATNTGYPDIAKSQVFQFNFSGDPALVRRRLNRLDATVSPSDPEPGESILINPAFSTDSTSYVLYDAEYSPHKKYPQYINNNSITLSDSSLPGPQTLVIRGKQNNSWKAATIGIQVSGTTIRWVSIDPESPQWFDPIEITIEAQDRQGIDSLLLYINGSQYGRFLSVGDDHYTLENAISGFYPGQTLSLTVKSIDSDGNITWTPARNLRIKSVIDVRPVSVSLAAEDSLYLMVDIENLVAESGVCTLKVFQNNDSVWSLVKQNLVAFSGRQTVQSRIPFIMPSGVNSLKIISITADSLSDRSNDTLVTEIEPQWFWVTPELGTTTDFQTHIAVHYRRLAVNIVSGSAKKAFILKLDDAAQIQTVGQPGFTKYFPTGALIEGVSDVPYTLSWVVDSIPPAGINLFRWEEPYNLWLPTDYSVQDSIASVEHQDSGIYAYFQISDTDKPLVEATLNGQTVLRNSYINKTPLINLVADDRNGIDPRPDAIGIWINDQKQSPAVIRQKTINNGVLSLQLNPTLTSNDSSMSIVVHDAIGKASDTLKLAFIVSEKLKLIDYGNYPNPFIDQTRFAYEITESVDDFSLNIYTVDGRRIRHFDEASTLTDLDPRIGAFHEIVWNGRTSNGDFVANGVYFYRIKVKKGKTILESKGKVVKAR